MYNQSFGDVSKRMCGFFATTIETSAVGHFWLLTAAYG